MAKVTVPAEVLSYEAANGPVPTYVENALREFPGLPTKGKRFPSFRAALDFAIAILSDPSITSDPADPERAVALAFDLRPDRADDFDLDAFAVGRIDPTDGTDRSRDGIYPGPIPGTEYFVF
jgi:hypothetical protein